MKNIKRVFSIIFLLIPFFLFAQNGFPLPDVPQSLKGPELRANYLALHYWDRYDFGNDALIGNKEISEQGFSNFISIMPFFRKFAYVRGKELINVDSLLPNKAATSFKVILLSSSIYI